MSDEIYSLQAELRENTSEISRHHRDFSEVSQLVEVALQEIDRLEMWPHTLDSQFFIAYEALKKIRNMVG